jgi:hypothetical protein
VWWILVITMQQEIIAMPPKSKFSRLMQVILRKLTALLLLLGAKGLKKFLQKRGYQATFFIFLLYFHF